MIGPTEPRLQNGCAGFTFPISEGRQVIIPTESPSSTATKVLGILSLVFGILALLICWIPVIGLLGLPLSGLGILLAIAAIAMILFQKGSGLILPIAGAAVCGFAIVVSIGMTFLLGKAVEVAGKAMLEQVNETDHLVKQQRRYDDAKAIFENAKVDLPTIIETAQASVPNGKPILAKPTREKGKHEFWVFFLAEGEMVSRASVDPVSGQADPDRFVENDIWLDHDDAKKALDMSKTTFAAAIESAKSKVPDGRPYSIEIERKLDKAIITVELMSGDKSVSVKIDAATGAVTDTSETTMTESTMTEDDEGESS
jgi:hypothetical protein